MERLLLGRELGIDDRGKRLVLDTDASRGAARLLGMLCGDERHRLTEVASAILGEDGLIRELEAIPLRSRHVLVGEHGMDSRHRQRRRDVDLHDVRVRMRAAERVAPQHPGSGQVARIRELPGDLRHAVGARNDLADAAQFELGDSRPAQSVPPALRTASKIFA